MEITQVAGQASGDTQAENSLNQDWTIDTNSDAVSNTTTIVLSGRLLVSVVETLYNQLKDQFTEDTSIVIDLTDVNELDLSIVQLFYYLKETNKTTRTIDFRWNEQNAFVSLIKRCGLNFFNKVN